MSACAAPAGTAGYPTFAAIPDAPTDVRGGGAWKRDVASIKAQGDKLTAETAPSTFTLSDTDGFAERTRRQLDAGGLPADEAATRAEADAFARSIRQRATPPPSRR